MYRHVDETCANIEQHCRLESLQPVALNPQSFGVITIKCLCKYEMNECLKRSYNIRKHNNIE